MVRLCRDTCSNVSPQTWLNESRANVGLSPTMGFLNDNDSLAYFAILVELSSGLSLTVGFLKTSSFLSLLVGFYRGQGRTYLATPYCFSWLKKTKYQKRIIFWRSELSLKYIPYNGDSRKTLDSDLKYVLPKSAFMFKTVATFVLKMGLIWLKDSIFTSVIQDTNVIVGLTLFIPGGVFSTSRPVNCSELRNERSHHLETW